jgi:hypothetical protein
MTIQASSRTVSPEELIHCVLLPFADAIRFLGCVFQFPGLMLPNL